MNLFNNKYNNAPSLWKENVKQNTSPNFLLPKRKRKFFCKGCGENLFSKTYKVHLKLFQKTNGEWIKHSKSSTLVCKKKSNFKDKVKYICIYCGKSHLEIHCRYKNNIDKIINIKCFHCFSKEHETYNCNTKIKKDSQIGTCYVCNKEHEYYCHSNNLESMNKVYCSNCSFEGHTYIQCNKEKYIEYSYGYIYNEYSRNLKENNLELSINLDDNKLRKNNHYLNRFSQPLLNIKDCKNVDYDFIDEEKCFINNITPNYTAIFNNNNEDVSENKKENLSKFNIKSKNLNLRKIINEITKKEIEINGKNNAINKYIKEEKFKFNNSCVIENKNCEDIIIKRHIKNEIKLNGGNLYYHNKLRKVILNKREKEYDSLKGENKKLKLEQC